MINKEKSVLEIAFKGYIASAAESLHISKTRLYEIIGRDNPYTKTWRLLHELGELNPDRLRFIQADFNARCEALYNRNRTPSDIAILHNKVSGAMQKILDKAPKCERKKEILEAISELYKELEKCDDN